MAETASKTPYLISQAYVAVGDPTVAQGAGMTVFEDDFPTVEVVLQTRSATASDRMGAQFADGAYTRATGALIRLTGYKAQLQALAPMIGAFVPNGEGFDLVDQTEGFEPPTLCVVPVNERPGAIDSGGVWWFPAVQATDQDMSLLYDATQEGPDANATYTIELRALKRFADQDDDAIPEGSRIGFVGAPDERDLAWSLPEFFDAPA
jgi:hypothetical protein